MSIDTCFLRRYHYNHTRVATTENKPEVCRLLEPAYLPLAVTAAVTENTISQISIFGGHTPSFITTLENTTEVHTIDTGSNVPTSVTLYRMPVRLRM